MGTDFQEVLCDENGIGGGGEYCGENDAQLGRINMFHYEASGGNYVTRAVFFDLEPGVIGTVSASPLGELSGKPREPYARAKMGQRPLQNC